MSGQRHLGKDQHVDAAGTRGIDDVEMLAPVRRNIAEDRCDLRDGEREMAFRRRHTSPCSLRKFFATSSTVFLSTSTLALRRAIVASSNFADSAFKYSASFGLASTTGLRTTGVNA